MTGGVEGAYPLGCRPMGTAEVAGRRRKERRVLFKLDSVCRGFHTAIFEFSVGFANRFLLDADTLSFLELVYFCEVSSDIVGWVLRLPFRELNLRKYCYTVCVPFADHLTFRIDRNRASFESTFLTFPV